jgi:hypothetical protein
MSTDSFVGDEARYLMFADNLAHGFYSPVNNINLWNGPGYPFILTPFVLLKLPLLTVKLLNAFLLFMAVLFFYKTLQLYIKNELHVVFISYLFGIYPPFFIYLHQILTETLSIFLICGLMFHTCKMFNDNRSSKKNFCIASLYLAYLALTKIFFGYVILAGTLLFLFLYFWKKKEIFRKIFAVYLFALLLCSPYLFYTYLLTNRIFYWGDSGGLSLYWMSTPYDNEFGDWFDYQKVFEDPQLGKHHDFFDKIRTLPSVQRDDELKKQAIINIKDHPLKYLKNISANIGRMLFNYPYSFVPQKKRTFFYIIPNMFLAVCSTICVYPYFARRRLIPGEIHFIAVFFVISFTGSALVSAYPRQFMILVPVLLFWLFIVISRTVHIELRH